MARPTFGQLATGTVSSTNLPIQNTRERWLVCLAMLASRMNPDGTTF